MISKAKPDKPRYVAVEPPTPEEIKRRAAKIRQGWSEREHRIRRGESPRRLEVTMVDRGLFGPNF